MASPTSARSQAQRVRNTAPREEVREEVRTDDFASRERRRKGVTDKYYINPKDIPSGHSYEWKRHTVVGERNFGYETELLEQGWSPVPVSRHPNMMPEGWTGPIERDGLVLMERPIHLTQEARREDDEAARDQIRRREQMNGETKKGNEAMPTTKPIIKSGTDTAIAVPKD